VRIARVVGNVVSTIKDQKFHGHKLMIVEFIDLNGKPIESRQIAFDAADAGVGDIVLVNVDGGATKILLLDDELIADWTICGVLDHYSVDGEMIRIP
jgi:microcompartment protein CcmK/EutM